MSCFINENYALKIAEIAGKNKTPFYLYDEKNLIKKCREAMSMPNAFGLHVRYAMKANSNRTFLKIVESQGLYIDASSLNEAKRAVMAGIEPKKIMLTTQEIPLGEDRAELESLMLQGMKYNACSLRQLYLIGDFAKNNNINLSVRLHPGVGAGESVTRNTGDKYSCFGIHIDDIITVLEYTAKMGIKITGVHVHIGSGGESEAWRENIDRELSFISKYFPQCDTVSFGGGLKEARMPDETAADIKALGEYATKKIEEFYKETGRKLMMEIEPGTYIAANSAVLVTSVVDKKRTGGDGFDFIITDGGMEVNTRPLLYGSCHPFFIISQKGELLSSEFMTDKLSRCTEKVIVGTCCESGDSQSLDETGHIIPRKMADCEVCDYVIVGGAGAYTSSMSLFNYNSHVQIAEILLKSDGTAKIIRKRQTLEQILVNESE